MDPLKLFELICATGKDTWAAYSIHQDSNGWMIRVATLFDAVDTFSTGTTIEEAITNAAIKLNLIPDPNTATNPGPTVKDRLKDPTTRDQVTSGLHSNLNALGAISHSPYDRNSSSVKELVSSVRRLSGGQELLKAYLPSDAMLLIGYWMIHNDTVTLEEIIDKWIKD